MHRVERSVEIEAPVEAAFDRFSDFESIPRWMQNIREVRRTGRKNFHWVSETAIEDLFAEWDAEVTVYEPDHRLVWRSVRGDIAADGEAILSVTPEGRTHLRVVLGFDTPLGRRGSQVSRFFGVRLGQQLEEDLDRFRRIVERGAARQERGGAAARRFAPVVAGGEPSDERRERDDRREGRRRVSRELTEDERPRERAEGRSAPRDEDEAGRRRRDEDEYSPRYALTPRERERERGLDRRDFDPRVSETFRRRGVDRLLDGEPPGRRRTRRD